MNAGKLALRILIVVISWWVSPVMSVALGAACTVSLRSFIVPRAAFWGIREILIVGVTWGLIMGVSMSTAIAYATSSLIMAGFLYFEGLVTVGFIAYQPSGVDIYGKSEQTSVTAWVVYILVVIGAVLYRSL